MDGEDLDHAELSVAQPDRSITGRDAADGRTRTTRLTAACVAEANVLSSARRSKIVTVVELVAAAHVVCHSGPLVGEACGDVRADFRGAGEAEARGQVAGVADVCVRLRTVIPVQQGLSDEARDGEADLAVAFAD